MKKKIFLIIVLSIFLVVILAMLINREKNSNTDEKVPNTLKYDIKVLKKNELREYNGISLSSIDDFRENSIKGPQFIDIKKYRLRVIGLVNKELDLRYNDVLKLTHYKKVVELKCVEGWSVKILWEGVRVKDLIERAGYYKDAKVLIFRAVDGYSTSFPLRWIFDNSILLAFKMNGITLPPQRGYPFQLVAEEKWGYKWIKWVNEIEVSNDESYRGYWEGYGYSQNGDINGPKLEKERNGNY